MAGRKAKIIYGILAVLIYGILAGVFVGKSIWLPGEKTYTDTETEYDMVMLGDSILGRVRDETGIPYQVAAALDITVYNGALGGTCMGRLEQTGYADFFRIWTAKESYAKFTGRGIDSAFKQFNVCAPLPDAQLWHFAPLPGVIGCLCAPKIGQVRLLRAEEIE